MSVRGSENIRHSGTPGSWEANGIHVLNSLNDLKVEFKEFAEVVRHDSVEVIKRLEQINSQFQRYNQFNDRIAILEKRKEDDRSKIEKIENQLTGIQAKVAWFVGLVTVALTGAINFVVSWFYTGSA